MEILKQSEHYLRENKEYSDAYSLNHLHGQLADQIEEIAHRIYEGHWAYGVSEETDQQFDELTEFLRELWNKERRAWISLAKAWRKL